MWYQLVERSQLVLNSLVRIRHENNLIYLQGRIDQINENHFTVLFTHSGDELLNDDEFYRIFNIDQLYNLFIEIYID